MKFVLSLLCIWLSLVVQSQVTVFKTFEDFQAEKGETYEEYEKYVINFGSFAMKLKNGSKSTKIKASNIWGFTYGDALFRIEGENNLPVMVLSLGKIVFYGNGLAFLTMIKEQDNSGSFYSGHHGYMSKDINSPIYPVVTRPVGALIAGDPHVSFKKFRDSHPEYTPIFRCIGAYYKNLDLMLECVQKFEAEELD